MASSYATFWLWVKVGAMLAIWLSGYLIGWAAAWSAGKWLGRR